MKCHQCVNTLPLLRTKFHIEHKLFVRCQLKDRRHCTIRGVRFHLESSSSIEGESHLNPALCRVTQGSSARMLSSLSVVMPTGTLQGNRHQNHQPSDVVMASVSNTNVAVPNYSHGATKHHFLNIRSEEIDYRRGIGHYSHC